MQYKMYLCLGDPSGDGHGKHSNILVSTNKPVEEIREAYKSSCQLTGISFNHNDDFTGIKRDFIEVRKYHVCAEYEEYKLTQECRKILNDFGISTENFNADPIEENFTKLWFNFVKLSLKDLEWQIIKDDIPKINGYGSGLNVQFGYGLYKRYDIDSD